jgi:hypothetical protein
MSFTGYKREYMEDRSNTQWLQIIYKAMEGI